MLPHLKEMSILGHGTALGAWFICIVMGVLLGPSNAAGGPAPAAFVPPGPNVALGKPYVLDPQPNYSTEPGDREQLTDGEYASQPGRSLWGQPGCVGWVLTSRVTITIDLGEIVPIAGLSFSSAAGPTGVSWPWVIVILVSDEGQDFHYVGELCSLSAQVEVPAPADYQEHRFATDQLRTHGRFLRLGIAAVGHFLVCDEIEVYRGPDGMLALPLDGPMITDLSTFISQHSVRRRIAVDIADTREAIAGAAIEPEVRQQLNEEIAAIEKANEAAPADLPADYRAIYPLNDNHARSLAVVAQLRRDQGFPPLFLWHNNRWQRLNLWDLPSRLPKQSPTLSVRMMCNETRAETLNIANFTDAPLNAQVKFVGLPGGQAPGYITVRKAEYVAMQSGIWDANALPVIPRERGGWRVTLPAGISQQLWLSFHPQDMPAPGRYRGRVVVEVEGTGQKLESRLRLVVEPFQFPDEPTLTLGMWDDTDSGGHHDLNERNLPAALAHMQSYHYNAPWAYPRVFPHPQASDFDGFGNLIKPLDMAPFDDWVRMWPEARYYMVFAAVGTSFAGATLGTPEFNQRVGSAMRAWADHAREIGIDPSQIGILLVDEPNKAEQDRRILAWAEAIKAGAPELLIFEDPIHAAPQDAEVPEMFKICDILCPSIYHYRHGGAAAAEFYDKLRRGGRELWFYDCGGGPPVKDAIAYYRAPEWECWKAQATGIGFWAYGDAGGIANSWNQLGATRIIYSPVYIDSDSVTDGKHWLAIIEGIQDHEYLRMLNDRVAELKAGGNSSEALTQAEELLVTLPDQVIAAAEEGDLAACDGGRAQVLDALVALTQNQ